MPPGRWKTWKNYGSLWGRFKAFCMAGRSIGGVPPCRTRGCEEPAATRFCRKKCHNAQEDRLHAPSPVNARRRPSSRRGPRARRAGGGHHVRTDQHAISHQPLIDATLPCAEHPPVPRNEGVYHGPRRPMRRDAASATSPLGGRESVHHHIPPPVSVGSVRSLDPLENNQTNDFMPFISSFFSL